MLGNILLKTLRDKRRSVLFWGIGLVVMAVIIMSFLPVITAESEAIEAYLEILPEEFMAAFGGDIADIATPEGFLNAELFFLMTPILFLVFTVGLGAGAIAGEEEQGTLDLLLANPLSRRRVLLEKFGAMSIGIILLAIIYWVGLAVGMVIVDEYVNLLNLAATCFSAALLGLTFGTLSLAIGCATGKRNLAMAGAGGLAVVTYFRKALAPVIDWLEPFRGISPFYYYIGGDPLYNGLNVGHAGVLIGLIVVLLIVALITFERRDLAV